MRVLLHLSRVGLYYAAPGHWVRQRSEALDLKTLRHATAVGHAEGLDCIQIVVSSGDPAFDWLMPLSPQQPARLQALPAPPQHSLLKPASESANRLANTGTSRTSPPAPPTALSPLAAPTESPARRPLPTDH
jgi:hypothetical protein